MPLGLSNIFNGLFKQYGHTVILLLRIVDLAMLLGAAWVSHYFWLRQVVIDQDYRIVIALGLLAAIIFFEIGQVYRPWRNDVMRGEIARIVRAWIFAVVSVITIVASIRLHFWFGSSYRWIITWWSLGLLFILTARGLLSQLLHWLRSRGWSQGRILLVGLNQMAVAVSRQLNNSSWAGLQVVGYVDDRSENRQSVGDLSLLRLGELQDLNAIVIREAIDEVWIAFPGESLAERAQYQLRHLPVSIRLVIDCFAFKHSKFLSLNTVAGIPTLDFSVSPLDGINRYVKEIMDRLSALILLLLISPLLLFIAIGVKLSSPGPVFYRQERVGWNNHSFTMLKFRSMPVNAEAATGAVWAKPGENRATRFGGFLRKTSLDELPQLINVLRGDMSLVGPRPERPDFVEVFKDQIPNYMKKHMVKAGITGWAQVNGWRGDTDLNRRIEHDLYYIQHWSVWFDLEIALRTVLTGFINKNAY
ncbi:undecaprenyl-phosphate glucose phosphotransferase [Methylicorpusculum sp.]|uniref:undecaprenyl-phosphate glucose phosphotransferase n=1 Tax=Methylicorpusculum sp. TaxID=2713644 RepID=UPI002730DDBA|nr:undecaprenyl-phosphate glucose phosphotransferase [Methylicorpusculum sp.]MDP2179050.1 undecaprenyl-phosphate glucose phosphotransferase [Methylicorpusculum sp.]MDP3529668.1 undecaprenyl-phosphate glucose phosphotransferase [Methylicorpusculum sp.]MDZ4152644.1 undecaprenyl-phosphate glucose phosphotransferase [Methylicorpusculum sp.]